MTVPAARPPLPRVPDDVLYRCENPVTLRGIVRSIRYFRYVAPSRRDHLGSRLRLELEYTGEGELTEMAEVLGLDLAEAASPGSDPDRAPVDAPPPHPRLRERWGGGCSARIVDAPPLGPTRISLTIMTRASAQTGPDSHVRNADLLSARRIETEIERQGWQGRVLGYEHLLGEESQVVSPERYPELFADEAAETPGSEAAGRTD